MNLDWNKICEKYGKKDSKFIRLCLLSETFILSIQRFDKDLNIKNHTSIIIKDIIDLKDYCDDLLSKNNVKYKLYCSIYHIGE